MKIKNEKGITLIALIITIIIMLILSGIVLTMTIGENGIIKWAEKAGRSYMDAAKNEERMLSEIVNEENNVTNGDGTSSSITNDNIGEYIDFGNNVVGTNATTDDWRILYVKDDKIYVILADYLPNSYGIDSLHTKGLSYRAGFKSNTVYTVFSEINRGTFLGTTNGIIGLLSNSKWSSLANGISGATVTGGPTIQMLMDSYNLKANIDLDYTTMPNDLETDMPEYSLYMPHTEEIDGCYGYWTISTFSGNSDELWRVSSDSTHTIYHAMYDSENYGIRPVVCLPNTTDIECTENGWKVKNTGIKSPTKLADLTNNNIGEYIDIGNNVVGTNVTTDDWRILYIKDNTIYLILADVLSNDYGVNASNTRGLAQKAGLAIAKSTTENYKYNVYIDTNRNDFLGTSEGTTGLRSNSAWSSLANGISGANVTGGPTVQMLMDSYNLKIEPDLEYSEDPDLGNKINDYSLYVPNTEEKDECKGYWTTTPHNSNENEIYRISFSSAGSVFHAWYDSRNYGIRPVIALPNTLNIERITDGWRVVR